MISIQPGNELPFCGVKFMADTAKILSPQKIVVLPDMDAGCSLEDSCPPEKFKAFREAHPDHIALTYINCSTEVKALSDVIVTSSSVETILAQIPPQFGGPIRMQCFPLARITAEAAVRLSSG